MGCDVEIDGEKNVSDSCKVVRAAQVGVAEESVGHGLRAEAYLSIDVFEDGEEGNGIN